MSKLQEKSYKTKGALLPFMKRLIKYSWKYKPWVIGFVVFVCVVAAAEALLPIAWKNFLDDVIVPGVKDYNTAMKNGVPFEADTSGLWMYFWIFLGLGLTIAGGVYCFIVFAGRIQEYV
ncbi:MAG TPA: hypothetical protein VK004_04065, partial [Ignavibacteria bacterium]|nr:hypothetical protein [Ignavibacteria bacterium]